MELPEVKLKVWEGTSGAKKSEVKTVETAEVINLKCEKAKDQPSSSEVTYKHKITLASKGELSEANRYQPYAKELKICVQAKVGAKDYRAETPVFENKAKTGSAEQVLYMSSGTLNGGACK